MSRALTPAKVATRRKSARRRFNSASVADVLELEAIPPDHVAALNAFYRNRLPAEITFAGQPAKIATAWPVARADDLSSCSLRVKLGDRSAELCAPLSLIEQLLATVDKTARLENLPPRHAALVLEAAVADELDRLEVQLQAPIELAAIERRKPSAGMPSFGFVLSAGGQQMHCTLRLDDGALLARLGTLLDAASSGEPSLPTAFPLPVRLWRDVLTLSLGEVRGLLQGDVVLLAEQAAAVLVIGDRLIAPASMTSSGPQLLAAPVTIAGSKWEWTMGQDTAAAGQALDDATLEDLPVALAFEVGRKAMPLGEIRQLTAGAVVQLDTTGQAVDILANGRRVGQGEMVRIGESLGVRVIRMFDNA
ncbi:type III secretion system cytoplasmic ring protein SctQ [Mesorhizobium sp. NPDC059054]|uniref:type III secretion system cytoplasmic ring protein SctQ n=1 Tax=Mesorhizobium sp. NPDC059054 TaxID=3346711 RepID=UPI0036A34EC5